MTSSCRAFIQVIDVLNRIFLSEPFGRYDTLSGLGAIYPSPVHGTYCTKPVNGERVKALQQQSTIVLSVSRMTFYTPTRNSLRIQHMSKLVFFKYFGPPLFKFTPNGLCKILNQERALGWLVKHTVHCPVRPAHRRIKRLHTTNFGNSFRPENVKIVC